MTTFYKVSGAGNDFVALVDPPILPDAGFVEAVCRRGLSLGADGVLALYRPAAGEASGEVRLVHFNADGQRNDFCLNGSRAAAQLAFELGCGASVGTGDPTLALATDVGVLACRRLDATRAEVTLPQGLVGHARGLDLEVDGARHPGAYVKVGVPHWVSCPPWPGCLADAPLTSLAPILRHHRDLGPGGANINFARVTSPESFEIRTFERGVEGETLACGSGVCATAQALLAAGWLQANRTLRALVAGGFELLVRPAADGRWSLAGDARIVAQGELAAGALQIPQPARWSP